MVEIEIDGKKVEVAEGSLVMEAARQAGTYIPHFCYHRKLSIAANCRMCLVEVEKAPKALPACATPVTAGMKVFTNSDKAVKAQKSVMEFLLINHPLDCPICDQGGECQLQDLAVGYGKSESRYQEEKRVVFHKNVGPLISMEEMTRCIHCTRCVRFGQEVAGVMELGMLNRGEHSEITTFVGQTVDSELSGNMIDLCPVGALTSKPFRYQARTWELARRKSVSPHDGLGANVIVQTKNQRVMRVLPLENEAINECWLSDKDRFAYEGLNSDERLTQPMLKQGGQWQTVDWTTALEYVANGLNEIKRDHGVEQIGALASPHSTLEELFLLQKLVRGIGSDNVDFRLRQSDFSAKPTGAPWLGMPIAEVSLLQRTLVVGAFLRKDHPLLAARLRQGGKKGAQLSVIGAGGEDLLMPATQLLGAPSQWLSLLSEVAVAIAAAGNVARPGGTDGVEAGETAKRIAASLASGERKAVFLGNAAVAHPQFSKLHALAQWVAQQTGATLGFLTEAANTVGGYLAGALPQGNGLDAAAMLAQPRRAYVIVGPSRNSMRRTRSRRVPRWSKPIPWSCCRRSPRAPRWNTPTCCCRSRRSRKPRAPSSIAKACRKASAVWSAAWAIRVRRGRCCACWVTCWACRASTTTRRKPCVTKCWPSRSPVGCRTRPPRRPPHRPRPRAASSAWPMCRSITPIRSCAVPVRCN